MLLSLLLLLHEIEMKRENPDKLMNIRKMYANNFVFEMFLST